MNYYGPRQRQSDLRWDYTCYNDRTGVYPVGYCRSFPVFTESDVQTVFHGSEEARDRYIEKLEPFKEKYHRDGHGTEEEACECYRQYLLDQRLRLDLVDQHTKSKCVICGEWTQGRAEVDMQQFVLCDEHRTREHVEQLFRVGTSISSY